MYCCVYSARLLMMDGGLSETCRVSFQNKFEKLVHLVGFIIRKSVMMHGHMAKKVSIIVMDFPDGRTWRGPGQLTAHPHLML